MTQTAGDTPGAGEEETVLKVFVPVRDGQQFIKKELLKQLSEITNNMIESAKDGETAPLRLLWELGKLHEDSTVTRKKLPPSLGKLLLDEIRKKDAQNQQATKSTGQ